MRSAASRRSASDRSRELLPLVRDRAWFFDTELLVLAQRAGLRIHEVPVDWVDDPDSRVEIVSTAIADLRGVVRLARDFRAGRPPKAATQSRFAGQVARFVVIGIFSTLAYAALYLLLRSAVDAQAANALALLLTAVGNTAANRRFTFAIRGPRRTVRHQLQGLAVFALALGVTSASLALLHVLDPAASRGGRARGADLGERHRHGPQVRAAPFLGIPSPPRSPGGRCMSTAATDTLAHRAPPVREGGRAHALLRGRADDPVWVRPALIGLLAATALLYLVDLAASG